MNVRHTLLMVAVLASIVLAGCAGGSGTSTPTVEESATEIRSEALESASNVPAYEAAADGTVIVTANNVEQTIDLANRLTVDRAALEYRRNLTQSVRGRTTTVEGYLLNETNYVKSPTNVQQYGAEWVRADVSGNATTLFDQYDLLEHYRQGLGNATVSVTGATVENGTTLRVLEADPNVTAFGEALSTGNQTTVTDAAITYWIDRDGTIHRVNATIDTTVESDRTTANRTTDVTVEFAYGDAQITLPDAADSAFNITDEQAVGSTNDGDDGSDPTDGNESGIEVRDGQLAVDPDQTFDRVERTLSTNVTDPASVVVQGSANLTDGNDGVDRRTLDSILGLESPSLAGTNVTLGSRAVPLAWLAEGRVDGVGNVYLHNAPGMSADVARVLTAHEFVHYVQLQNDRFRAVNAATDATTDGSYARKATTEGAAVFTTDTLLARYESDGPRNVELYRGIAAAAPNGSARELGNSWYRYGNRYVESRIDDPAELDAVYENPPTTSEQVLHRLDPGTEPPAPLSVRVETDSEYVAAGSDRKGEAYIRYVLANGVSLERAGEAAEGWGNDTVRSIRPADGEGNTSYVWVHRWDDADNATEFATAARTYLDEYGTTETTALNGVPVAFERLSDRTTAFVIGAEPFQESVSLSTESGAVVVETE